MQHPFNFLPLPMETTCNRDVYVIQVQKYFTTPADPRSSEQVFSSFLFFQSELSIGIFLPWHDQLHFEPEIFFSWQKLPETKSHTTASHSFPYSPPSSYSIYSVSHNKAYFVSRTERELLNKSLKTFQQYSEFCSLYFIQQHPTLLIIPFLNCFSFWWYPPLYL